MHNFLNTTFKFLSRSLFITAIFLFSFQFTQAAPVITEFKSSTNTAIPEGNWTLSWKVTGAAGCKLVTSDCGGTGSACGAGFYNPNSQVKLDDNGIDTYTYTLKCYSKIDEVFYPNPDSINQTPIYTTKYTVNSPVPQTVDGPISGGLALSGRDQEVVSSPVIVKVIDASTSNCTDSPNPGLCTQMCTVYGETAASCQTCKTDAEKCETFAGKCLTDEGGRPENQSTEDRNICATGDINQAEEGEGGVDKTPVAPEECGLVFGSWGQCAIDAALFIVKATIVSLAASFLQLCAYIFEFSIQISIVQFSNLVTGGDTPWLTNIWGIIRDVLNIGVIFVLLYAAIQVIVGRGGEIKKLIAGVILFGVMTNFSLFLTKAAVDITNVIALEFYQQMRTVPLSDAAFSGGLGASVVSITGLTNFYDPNPIEGDAELKSTNKDALKDSFLYLFAMAFVFIAVGFVFLQAAGLFIFRTVSLILLLVFSPLMFAGAIFSPLQKWIADWHKEFLGQITVAPIFMILLYVVLTILGSLVKAVDDSLKNNIDMFSFLALILITSALTVVGFGAALSQAKKYAGSIGGVGAKWGGKLGGVALGGAGKIALGGAASGLRTAAVWTGARNLSNWAQKSDSVAGSAFRLLGVNKIKDSTFDIRNTKVGAKLGTGVSAALGAAGVDVSSVKLGEGSKTKLADQKGFIQAGKDKYAQIQKGVQERADKRGDTRVEQALKDIEANQNKKGIKTDNSIFDVDLKTRAAAGTIQTQSRGLETDEEWEKKVKVANQKNKSSISSLKSEYLKSDAVLSLQSFGKNFVFRRGLVAEYNARQKYSKQFKDSPDTKLKAYTDGLKKIEYQNIHGATSEEIDVMSDDDRITLWQTLSREADKEIKDIESHLDPNPGAARDEQLARKKKWALLSNQGKNASKKIGEFKKKIEEGGKKKEEGKNKT